MRAWLCVIALAGCDHVFGIGDPYEDAPRGIPGSDAMHDTPVDMPADMMADGLGAPGAALLIRFPFDGDLQDATRTKTAMASGSYTVQSTGGEFGGEVTLDGTGCLSFAFTQQPTLFSIVFWVEETASNGTYVPLLVRPHDTASMTQDWAFYGNNATIRFSMANNVGSQTYAASPGLSTGWRQYAATFDGSLLRLYVDGADMGGVSGTAPSYGAGGLIYLGCDGSGGTNAKFAGSFDEVEIYDGVLTDSQMLALTMAPPL